MFTVPQIISGAFVLCLLQNVYSLDDNFCERNETNIRSIPVTKTRTVVKTPTGPFKLFKKSKTYTEPYQDFAEEITWKIVRDCCDGFKMTAHKTCEPVCEKGCPVHAKCVEPNRCHCEKGYITAISPKDGAHYCEPICESGCPVYGRCIAPEECECESGYHVEQFKCVPYCSTGCPYGGICLQPEVCQCKLGYTAIAGTCKPVCKVGAGCRNGICIDTEQCVCKLGFTWNNETEVCEATAVTCEDATCANEQTGNQLETTTATGVTMTKLRNQVIDANANAVEEQGIDYEMDFTENEKIYLSTPHTVHTGTYQSITEKPLKSTNACPVGYIYYHGECRAEIFASNEADCRFKPCAKYAICQEDGTCACQQGFIAQKPQKLRELQLNNFEYYETTENVEYISSTSTESTINSAEFSTTTETLDAAELVCISLTQLNADLQNFETAKTYGGENKWINAFFIALGLGCILCAALFLSVKLMRQQRGKMDVEGKNNLQCTYDNKGLSQTQMVL